MAPGSGRLALNEEEPKRALWQAMLTACGIVERELTPVNRPEYQRCARKLWQMGATPAEVARRTVAMGEAWGLKITPRTLVKHYADFARAPQRPAPVAGLFWHPDRCPSPCSGCAADRKASA